MVLKPLEITSLIILRRCCCCCWLIFSLSRLLLELSLVLVLSLANIVIKCSFGSLISWAIRTTRSLSWLDVVDEDDGEDVVLEWDGFVPNFNEDDTNFSINGFWLIRWLLIVGYCDGAIVVAEIVHDSNTALHLYHAKYAESRAKWAGSGTRSVFCLKNFPITSSSNSRGRWVMIYLPCGYHWFALSGLG